MKIRTKGWARAEEPSESYGADILRALHAQQGIETKHVLDDGSAIIDPGHDGHQRRGWHLIGDNGGEINIYRINHYHVAAIPFTHRHEYIDADTMAYRIAKAIRGEIIDWTFRVPDAAKAMEAA